MDDPGIQELPEATLSTAADDLAATEVVAALESAHRDSTNLIWCAAFQLAWNELQSLVGEPIALEGAPHLADRLAAASAQSFGLPEDSYVAQAGLVSDGVVDAIRSELRSKFGNTAVVEHLPMNLSEDDVLAYAYLLRDLVFETPFLRDDQRLRFNGTPVAGFGLWQDDDDRQWQERARQINVHSYGGRDDFVIELRTKSADDRLFIARVEPGATLADTVETALSRLDEEENNQFRPVDVFLTPRLDFKLTEKFEELEGRRLSNQEFTNNAIVSAKESIRFRLDEKGAFLRAEAAAVASDTPVDVRPRSFVCDGPYLVMLQRQGADAPYLVVWVAAEEILTRR